MFSGARAFNQPLAFNTSQVTDMRFMFYDATEFNQPLTFDTSQVTDMRGMFQSASAFNQPLTFDTSQVTNMEQMFWNARAFNQPLTFDTSQVTTMNGNNSTTTSYSRNWDTRNVTNMRYMFSGARAFNQPLTFDTSQVTDMRGMFSKATAFNQPLTLNTSQVTDMRFMFSGARAFNQPLTFDTSQVTDMRGMFSKATAFNQPLTLNTSQVTDMKLMFCEAMAFNQPLDWDTRKVTTMEQMFWYATAMTYPRPRVGESEEEAEHRQRQLVKMNRIIATRSGGIFVTDDFRKLPNTCLVKPDPDPDPDDPDPFISKSHVKLLTQGDIIMMETSTLGPARCLPCKHVFGTPELHQWLNQNDKDIEQNMDPDAGGLLGLAPRFKNECPTCRATIKQVEILSLTQAKKWDMYEGMALKEEKKLKAELRDFKKSAEYKQYVSNVSTAKIALKYVQEKLEGEKKILQKEERNIAKIALKYVQEKLEGEKKILQKEERKGAEMRETSDKIQKGYRDLRLFKPNVPLTF